MSECTSLEIWLIYLYPKGYYLPMEYIQEWEQRIKQKDAIAKTEDK